MVAPLTHQPISWFVKDVIPGNSYAMPDSSPDPSPSEPDLLRSSGRSTIPTSLMVVIGGLCLLMVVACVICIGVGLVAPLAVRNRLESVEEAERAAVEARDAAMKAQQAADEEVRKLQETLGRELDTARELKERGEKPDPEQGAVPDDGDDSSEQKESK
jgi:hypothetical protein